MNPGDVFEIKYQFVRDEKLPEFWKIGVRFEDDGPEDVRAIADGEGKQILTFVSSFRPGKGYQERIFFLRRWITPDGEEFGTRRLQVATRSKFQSLILGYRHRYQLEDINA